MSATGILPAGRRLPAGTLLDLADRDGKNGSGRPPRSLSCSSAALAAPVTVTGPRLWPRRRRGRRPPGTPSAAPARGASHCALSRAATAAQPETPPAACRPARPGTPPGSAGRPLGQLMEAMSGTAGKRLQGVKGCQGRAVPLPARCPPAEPGEPKAAMRGAIRETRRARVRLNARFVTSPGRPRDGDAGAGLTGPAPAASRPPGHPGTANSPRRSPPAPMGWTRCSRRALAACPASKWAGQ